MIFLDFISIIPMGNPIEEGLVRDGISPKSSYYTPLATQIICTLLSLKQDWGDGPCLFPSPSAENSTKVRRLKNDPMFCLRFKIIIPLGKQETENGEQTYPPGNDERAHISYQRQHFWVDDFPATVGIQGNFGPAPPLATSLVSLDGKYHARTFFLVKFVIYRRYRTCIYIYIWCINYQHISYVICQISNIIHHIHYHIDL